MDYTTQPIHTTHPDSETKEVTSELIIMHESFLRTKPPKLITNINNICFYIGNGEKEIR